MRSILIAIICCLAIAQARAQVPGLPAIDFQRYFPHLVAISEDSKDATYPNGVQYKFLSVRDEQEKLIVLALVRREGKDRIVRVFLAKGPIENSETTLRNTVAKFSDTTKLKFEFFDLRDIKTFSDFEGRSSALEWGVTTLAQ